MRETLWNPFFSKEREKVDCIENRAYVVDRVHNIELLKF